MIKIENIDVYGWEDIEGYEGIYMINKNGDIKSVRNNKLIKAFTTNCGYKMVELNLNGKPKKYLVHRLVAQTFISNPDNKTQVNHIDGNKFNNNADNLEWTTPKENMKHASKNKLCASGENNGASKLTIEEVKWIKNNYIKGDLEYGQNALSKKFKVDKKTIFDIVNERTWKGVK